MIHSDALEMERVAIAVEHLIHGLPIERKDPKSALSPASYVRWELNLSNALKAVAEKEVDPAMTTLSAIIDRTWGNDEQSALALVKQIQKTLPALGEAIADNAIPVTEHTSKKILTTIRKELGATKKFGHMPKDWVTTWTLRDERALDIIARKPAFWIGQRYETKHIEAATRIIDASLDLGLGTDQTAVFLKESLGKELADYHYWDVLSSAVVNRSRTSGVLYAMQDAGFEIYQILTAGDDAVCFTRGMPIATPEGDKPIESIKPGDLVLTHLGPRRVTATMNRDYTGALVRVPGGIATEDHPYLVLRGGRFQWVPAGSVRASDVLCRMEGQPDCLGGTDSSDIALIDVDDIPALSPQPYIPTPILDRISMPEAAICLYDDPIVRDKEIYAVTPNLNFLSEGAMKLAKSQSDIPLEGILSDGAPVALKGTKAATDCFGGGNPEMAAAMLTGNDLRGATASLGAIVIRPIFLRDECLSTTEAFPVIGCAQSALSGADRVSVAMRSTDGEFLAASRAGLGDVVVLGGKIAFAGAEGSRSPVLELLSASAAGIGLFQRMGSSPSVKAGARAILPPDVSLESGSAILTARDKRHGNQSSVVVYSIQVEDANTFFAGGVLVHNCDICEHMAGQQFSIQESIDTLEGTFELENPEDLKDITPWLGWDEKDGEPFYKDSEGKRHGVGNMSSAELQKNGIGQPPFHGLCRCTIVLVGRYGRTFTGAMSIDSLAAKLRQWPPAALSRARIAVLRSAPRVAGELVTVSFGSDGATIDVRRGASQRLVHGAIARAWVVGAKEEEITLWRTWAEKDALAVPENGFAARELMASQLALYVSGAYDYIGEGTEQAFKELLAVDIRERNERLALCQEAADDHE